MQEKHVEHVPSISKTSTKRGRSYGKATPRNKLKVDLDKQDLSIFDPKFVRVSTRMGDYKKILPLQELIDLNPQNIPAYQVVEIIVVRENIDRLLKHYGLTLKYNVFTDMPDIYQHDNYAGTLDNLFIDILGKCSKQNLKIANQRLHNELL